MIPVVWYDKSTSFMYHCFRKVIDIEFDGRAKDDCNLKKIDYYNFVLIWDEYE